MSIRPRSYESDQGCFLRPKTMTGFDYVNFDPLMAGFE